MSSDLSLAGIRDAVMGVSALVPAARVEGDMATRQSLEMTHRLQSEQRADAAGDKQPLGTDTSKATLPMLVAERARTPTPNALWLEPEIRGRRRKLRRFPRSRFTELAQEVGRHLDVSV